MVLAPATLLKTGSVALLVAGDVLLSGSDPILGSLVATFGSLLLTLVAIWGSRRRKPTNDQQGDASREVVILLEAQVAEMNTKLLEIETQMKRLTRENTNLKVRLARMQKRQT